jgi:hypothetical protein
VVDIVEDETEYLIKVDLPEIKKEEVKVTVENGVLVRIKQAWFCSPVERPLNVRRKRAIVDPGWCLAFGFDLISI